MFALKSLNLAFSSAVPVFNPNSSLNDWRARLVPMKADYYGKGSKIVSKIGIAEARSAALDSHRIRSSRTPNMRGTHRCRLSSCRPP
jgi:hypothetical protein